MVVQTYRRECIDKTCFLIRFVGKGMRSPSRNDHEVPLFRIHNLPFQSGNVRNMKSNGAFGHEKGLVMHFVPMSGWARRSGGNDELYGRDAVIC